MPFLPQALRTAARTALPPQPEPEPRTEPEVVPEPQVADAGLEAARTPVEYIEATYVYCRHGRLLKSKFGTQGSCVNGCKVRAA